MGTRRFPRIFGFSTLVVAALVVCSAASAGRTSPSRALVCNPRGHWVAIPPDARRYFEASNYRTTRVRFVSGHLSATFESGGFFLLSGAAEMTEMRGTSRGDFTSIIEYQGSRYRVRSGHLRATVNSTVRVDGMTITDSHGNVTHPTIPEFTGDGTVDWPIVCTSSQLQLTVTVGGSPLTLVFHH